MPEAPLVYTIGHSTHDLTYFLGLLKRHGITAVADVRSSPYSRLEHFRQKPLKHALKKEGIAYIFLGQELGARRSEAECYVGRQVVYERMAQLPAFQEGLARLIKGSQSQVIALMCAEREPLDCHRTIVVARHMTKLGCHIRHILADGQCEEHADTERWLLNQSIADPLFDGMLDETALIDRAYEERGREIAYRTNEEVSG